MSALPDKLTCCSWLLQLKDKHKQTGGNVGAMEELENAFSLAEESCPGISDKLIAHMVERVQRWVPLRVQAEWSWSELHHGHTL